MDVRQSIHSAHAKTLDTQGLRSEFLVEQVFEADKYTMSTAILTALLWAGLCRWRKPSPWAVKWANSWA